MIQPTWTDKERGFALYLGDCEGVLPHIEAVDSIVTDPPYGLKFMGRKWDYEVPSIAIWRACYQSLKPGGHLLAFGGTRTYHRMVRNIEDAGFEIRDMIAWMYGSGFPKSRDVSKAIDVEAGVEREVIGEKSSGLSHGTGNSTRFANSLNERGKVDVTAPATSEAIKWQGWGTALKPALEPIVVARKPLAGTVAENVQEHGTGAINVDACRVGDEDVTINTFDDGAKPFGGGAGHEYTGRTVKGRWPANVILDEAAGRELDKQSEEGASRFFYCAKAGKDDRGAENDHPTVKPTDLMRYLCRLVTQPGGIVLDPFMGSGSTGKAAGIEQFRFIGIERDEESYKIAVARIEASLMQGVLF